MSPRYLYDDPSQGSVLQEATRYESTRYLSTGTCWLCDKPSYRLGMCHNHYTVQGLFKIRIARVLERLGFTELVEWFTWRDAEHRYLVFQHNGKVEFLVRKAGSHGDMDDVPITEGAIIRMLQRLFGKEKLPQQQWDAIFGVEIKRLQKDAYVHRLRRKGIKFDTKRRPIND